MPLYIFSISSKWASQPALTHLLENELNVARAISNSTTCRYTPTKKFFWKAYDIFNIFFHIFQFRNISTIQLYFFPHTFEILYQPQDNIHQNHEIIA